MMTKMREMSWIFFLIVILSFVGMMIFDWGMDALGMKGRGSNIVGQVYDYEITAPEFKKFMENAYENEKNRDGKAPSQERITDLKQETWDQLVRNIIMQREVDKRGIIVSDEEVAGYVKAYFKVNPNFMTDGKFDENKWAQAITNPNIPWAQIEGQFRSQLPMTKLEQLISSAAYVGEGEVRQTALEELTSYDINQLGLAFSEFRDEKIEIDSTELQKYYEEHLFDYKQEEQRKLEYVFVKLSPTKEDTLLIYKDASALKERIQNGESISSLAKVYSEEPGAKNSGGDLGWFTKGRMVKPFEKAVFAAKKGDIVGPVKTGFGFHVIEITDKRVNDNGEEEINASHILLNIVSSRATEDRAYGRILALSETAKEREFTEAAKELGLEVKETAFFPKSSPSLPGAGNIPGSVSFAFSASAEEVSRSFRTDDGYYLFYLVEIKESGHRSFKDVKNSIEQKVRNFKIAEMANKYLRENIDALIKEGKTLKEISQMDFTKKITFRDNISFTLNRGVPGLGNKPEAMAKFKEYDSGTVNGPLAGNSSTYYIDIIDKKVPDDSQLSIRIENVRERLLRTNQNTYFNNWYQEKLKEAEVKDFRSEFDLI